MALRGNPGSLVVVALAAAALTACKASGGGSNDAGSEAAAAKVEEAAAGLDKRCEQLGKACGDTDKHQEKITEECQAAARKQVEKGCADKASALYDCYEKELCGKFEDEKVWAIDDFRVLAERHSRCLAQRNTSDACVSNTK